MEPNILKASWNAPPSIKALTLCKDANLADIALAEPPRVLNQVHQNTVCQWKGPYIPHVDADAAFTEKPNIVCAVQTADCLPLVLTNTHGFFVATIHAGWRGLQAKVISKTLDKLNQDPKQILVWIGPGISAKHYVVSKDVFEAFDYKKAFEKIQNDQWLCDLYALAKYELLQNQVLDSNIFGGQFCTYSDPTRFYSYRYNPNIQKRLLTLAWIKPQS